MRTPRASFAVAPLRVAAVVAAALLLLLAVAAPASAHSEEGEMTVVGATESEPLTISVEVGLVYASDQHLAEEAEVWVDASTADTQLEPVRLTRAGEGSAVYAGTIPVPAAGEWTLSFESTDPVASAEATVIVAGEPAASTTTSTSAAPASTTTPGTDDTHTAATEDDDARDEAEDDGLSAVVIALVAVGVVVVLAAGVALLQRRRNPG